MLANVDLLAIDLDGTLVDSAPDLAYCVGCALEAVELEPPGEALTREWIGDGVETLVQRALSHAASPNVETETFAAAVASFTSCYEHNLFNKSRLYPEAAATLDALAARGIELCCVTNKRQAFADGLLSLAGIRDRFGLVFGGDTLTERKPSPMQLEEAARLTGVTASRAVMVGDSRHDLHAARAAGYSFIWAAYGYFADLDDRSSSPIARIERFSDLATLA